MGKTYMLKFSLDIFPEAWRPRIQDFLEGRKSGEGTRLSLKLTKETWDNWLATLFLMGISDDEPEAELRRV